MRKSDDKTTLSHGYVVSVLFGSGIGFLLMLLVFAVFAGIISSGKLSEDLVPHVLAFSAFLGSAAGAFAATKRHKGRLMLVSLGVGSLLFVVPLLVSLTVGHGRLFNGLTLALYISFTAGGILGGCLSLKRRKHKRS